MTKFWKQTPLIALALAAALLIAGLLIAFYYEQSYKSQSISAISVQARILSSSVTAALVFDDDAAVQEYINAQKSNPEVLGVAVYNATGSRVAGYTKFENEILPDTVQPHEPLFEDNRLVVTMPVN